MTDEEIKLFNRMISVKHTIRYLFLWGLEQYEPYPATSFVRRYGWKLNISYLYALIHAWKDPMGAAGLKDDGRSRVFARSATSA
ncbi:hypothetical protein PM3016_2012 [Paenibacillus mucilaginosus 3016]|uniref:Uncharacterized protein n=1 Tax=Paenibacillus mucilaginosus 3016 TaxID=1116391 RepID=H6NA68_9BACL|nr:hypothetical protein PM3016_2012 [Paenibacillus mucilaginosus 3016]